MNFDLKYKTDYVVKATIITPGLTQVVELCCTIYPMDGFREGEANEFLEDIYKAWKAATRRRDKQETFTVTEIVKPKEPARIVVFNDKA